MKNAPWIRVLRGSQRRYRSGLRLQGAREIGRACGPCDLMERDAWSKDQPPEPPAQTGAWVPILADGGDAAMPATITRIRRACVRDRELKQAGRAAHGWKTCFVRSPSPTGQNWFEDQFTRRTGNNAQGYSGLCCRAGSIRALGCSKVPDIQSTFQADGRPRTCRISRRAGSLANLAAATV